ncbi:MAG: EFR1 family ferrodoxin [bacterium]
MNTQSLKLVYFSPTGTTKAIIQSIARGINHCTVELIDITKPDARKQTLRTSEKELLIIGVPVYMGRVPALVTEWLNTIKAQNTPTVCVVVYGNRTYEDALLELKDILTSCGCKPIAGAAYIGEHSFSNNETPIAKDRPDVSDLCHAESFGREIQKKLIIISSIEEIANINLPGCYPYRSDSKLWVVDFIAVGKKCVQCGVCAEICPTGAIDAGNSGLIDKEKCITCCACIKSCPQNARTIKAGPVKDASIRLNKLYKERKEPELFL